MGKLHPVAWYHNYDGGRSFYTALGHIPSIYSDPAFLNHLYAGIFWAATGKK
jgi:type 1 glutamine amidotransferase